MGSQSGSGPGHSSGAGGGQMGQQDMTQKINPKTGKPYTEAERQQEQKSGQTGQQQGGSGSSHPGKAS